MIAIIPRDTALANVIMPKSTAAIRVLGDLVGCPQAGKTNDSHWYPDLGQVEKPTESLGFFYVFLFFLMFSLLS